MISALFIAPQGFAQIVHVAEPGNTFKPTVFGTGLGVYDHQDIASEPLGLATVTFSGVQAGSEIRVYSADMTELAGVESCAANQTLSWPAFGAGSPNNTVRIVILSNTYRLKEFTYTSSVGAQNLPIQQERDQWYSNPA